MVKIPGFISVSVPLILDYFEIEYEPKITILFTVLKLFVYLLFLKVEPRMKW